MLNIFQVLVLYHGEPDLGAKAFLQKAQTIYCKWLCLTIFFDNFLLLSQKDDIHHKCVFCAC